MSATTSTRVIVSAFHRARTDGDLEAARLFLASAFTFQSPLMRFDDPVAYLSSHSQFQRVVTGFEMISQLYGDDEATLVYDLHTATPAGTQRAAEHLALVDGKISKIVLIFDSSPWRSMLEGVGLIDTDQ